jgi:hypothetical protein
MPLDSWLKMTPEAQTAFCERFSRLYWAICYTRPGKDERSPCVSMYLDYYDTLSEASNALDTIDRVSDGTYNLALVAV